VRALVAGPGGASQSQGATAGTAGTVVTLTLPASHG
jgi:hypothetical protein